MMNILVSLSPVILFLLLFLLLDFLRLTNKNLLLVCILWGVFCAALSYFLNTFFIRSLHIGFSHYSGFIAPFVEELLKMSVMVYLIRKNKIGFMIDGALYGFAVGSGFALSENLFYLSHLSPDAGSLFLWVSRGFGTAMMHGGTTAIFGIMTMSAVNRNIRSGVSFVPGAVLAVIFHMIYNFFLIPPLFSALLIFILVPSAIIFLFWKNGKTIRKWLDLEFDDEMKIIVMIRKGRLSETRYGSFLHSMKDHFPAETVVDLYCFISLFLELSMKTKSILMLRENGLPVGEEPGIQDKLRELRTLRKTIGKAGIMAVSPILRVSAKDLWKLSVLDSTKK